MEGFRKVKKIGIFPENNYLLYFLVAYTPAFRPYVIHLMPATIFRIFATETFESLLLDF